MNTTLDERLKKDYVGMGAYVVYGGPRIIELTDQDGGKIEISRTVSIYFPVRGTLVEVEDPVRGKIRRIVDEGSDGLYWFLIEVYETCVPRALTGVVQWMRVSWEGLDAHHVGFLFGCTEDNDAVVLEFKQHEDRRYKMGVLVLMGHRYPFELSSMAVAVGYQTYQANGVLRMPRVR